MIGILGAMPAEIIGLKQLMTSVSTKTIAGREFITGELGGKQVTLVFSQWGKVAAATTVTTLIGTFLAKKIVFTGVAGSVNPELKVGDIVIAKGLYQHDMDAMPIFPRHEIPGTGKTLYSPDLELSELATKAAEEFLQPEVYNQIIPEEVQEEFGCQAPKLIVNGIVGSGDKFFASKEDIAELKKQAKRIDAVEMEGAAVAQVCDEHNIPFVVVRYISDNSDCNAHLDFLKFTEQVASLYSSQIVSGILRDLSPSPQQKTIFHSQVPVRVLDKTPTPISDKV